MTNVTNCGGDSADRGTRQTESGAFRLASMVVVRSDRRRYDAPSVRKARRKIGYTSSTNFSKAVQQHEQRKHN